MIVSAETFLSLLQDWNHWAFELVLMAIFDGLIGLLLWPRFKKRFVHRHDCQEDCNTLEYRVLRLEKIIEPKQWSVGLEDLNKRFMENIERLD